MNETLARIRRAAFFVEIRVRFARVIRLVPVVLAIGLSLAAVALGVHKVWPEHLTEHAARLIFIGLGSAAGLAWLVAFVLPLPPNTGTLALDKHYKLDGRLTNATAFEEIPANERTELMQAAIDDAREHTKGIKPRRVAPILGVIGASVASVEMGLAVAAGGGIAALAMLEIQTLRPEIPEIPPPPPGAPGMGMNRDDIDLFKDVSKQLDRENQTPEMKAILDRFNHLLEDLANRKLDRKEAFRQLDEIERDLKKSVNEDQDLLARNLKDTGDDLSKSDLTKDLADALKKDDLNKAKDKLKALADELRRSKKTLNADAKKKLEAALKAAADRRKAAAEESSGRKSLLKREIDEKQKDLDNEKDPKKAAEKKKLLDDKKRELKRLEDESTHQDKVSRALSKLDEDLQKAAEDLAKDLDTSAEDLDKAAEDINHLQEEQMSEDDKKELLERLKELKELMRQQGQGGKKRANRMKNFSKRARGKSGKPGAPGQDGGQQDDQGDQGDQDGEDGQDGQDGQGKKPGGSKPGGKLGGIELKHGKSPSGGGKPGGSGDGDGQDGSQPGGTGDQPGGHSYGSGSGGPIAGKNPTDLKGNTQDVHLGGTDTGQGPSKSRSIMVAAEKGFRGDDYKQVYTKYQTQTEDDMNEEHVPNGYRFYVKRYFEFIRPRD